MCTPTITFQRESINKVEGLLEMVAGLGLIVQDYATRSPSGGIINADDPVGGAPSKKKMK